MSNQVGDCFKFSGLLRKPELYPKLSIVSGILLALVENPMIEATVHFKLMIKGFPTHEFTT